MNEKNNYHAIIIIFSLMVILCYRIKVICYQYIRTYFYFAFGIYVLSQHYAFLLNFSVFRHILFKIIENNDACIKYKTYFCKMKRRDF